MGAKKHKWYVPLVFTDIFCFIIKDVRQNFPWSNVWNISIRSLWAFGFDYICKGFRMKEYKTDIASDIISALTQSPELCINRKRRSKNSGKFKPVNKFYAMLFSRNLRTLYTFLSIIGYRYRNRNIWTANSWKYILSFKTRKSEVYCKNLRPYRIIKSHNLLLAG